MARKKTATQGKMTVSEAGRRGGEATKKRHGPEFYEQIGKKGGKATKRTHGPQFYKDIGLKGGRPLKQLIEAGKKATRHTEVTRPAKPSA